MSVRGDDQGAPAPLPLGALDPEAASPGGASPPEASERGGLESPALRAAFGTLMGFSLVALTNAFAIAWAIPLPRGGLGLRLAHHAFDAAQTLGLGALVAISLGAFLRFVALPVWAAAIVYAAAVAPILYAMVGSDLFRQATIPFDGRLEIPLLIAFLSLSSPGLAGAQ